MDMDRISIKNDKIEITFYREQNSFDQFDSQTLSQTQQFSKKPMYDLQISNEAQLEDKNEFQKYLLIQKSFQFAQEFPKFPQQKKDPIYCSISSKKTNQDERLIGSHQTRKNFKNQAEKHSNSQIDAEQPQVEDIDTEIGLNQSNQNQNELLLQVNQKLSTSIQKQFQFKELQMQKSRQKIKTKQQKIGHQIFFDEESLLKYSQSFNFKFDKERYSSSQNTDYFIKSTLNQKIISLTKTILQNSKEKVKNQSQNKTLYSIKEDCVIFFVLKTLYKLYPLIQIKKIISQIILRNEYSVQRRFKKLSKLTQDQIIQSLKLHIQTGSIFLNKTQELKNKKDEQFLKDTLNKEIINLAKTFIVNNINTCRTTFKFYFYFIIVSTYCSKCLTFIFYHFNIEIKILNYIKRKLHLSKT